MSDLSHSPPVPRWLRAWAVLTVLAALPLVTLGAEVTTRQVGMVDPTGFRAPWHLFTVAGDQLYLGYLIEHGHRLAGFVVGICCIVLAAGMAPFARGGLHRWLGVLALMAVASQGLLGIFRVNLNALMGPGLAALHGSFAQLVFATLVAAAVLSASLWSRPVSTPDGLRTVGVWLMVLLFAQVVFGATTRHLLTLYPVAKWLHFLLAFVVVGLVFLMAGRLWREGDNTAARRLALLLVALVLVQPILGLHAWMGRFRPDTLPELVPSNPTLDLVRSGHHVLGTLIFATTVALVVLLFRPAKVAEEQETTWTGSRPGREPLDVIRPMTHVALSARQGESNS